MPKSTTFTEWDYKLATMKDDAAKAAREHDEEYSDVVAALAVLGLDPRRLRDYLAGLSEY